MSERMLPEGRLVKVEFETRLPAAATEAQIEQWLLASMGYGGIGADNPLYDEELEAFPPSAVFLRDTCMQGRREEFDHHDDGEGSRTYKVRYIRERQQSGDREGSSADAGSLT